MLARGSSPFLLGPALGLFAAAAVGAAGLRDAATGLGIAAGVLLLAFLLFFRDPERVVAEGAVSAADGRVLEARRDAAGTRIVVFMAPWSVHVNRAPVAGRIVRMSYRRGGHRPAFSKESEHNERVDLTIAAADGEVDVALIAGTVARRVHPYVTVGDIVEKGDRIGLIAFGSRCEVRLPEAYVPLVPPGAWIQGGSTSIARKASGP